LACGFHPVEELTELDPHNPLLLLVKPLEVGGIA
jgi:hypothetical protein